MGRRQRPSAGRTGVDRDLGAGPDEVVERAFRVWRVVLAGVPLVFVPGLADVFMVPKLVVLAGATAWIARTLLRAGVVPLPRLARPVGIGLAVLVGVVTVSTLFSVAPRLSLVGVDQRFGGLVPLLVVMAAGLLTGRLVDGRPDRVTALGRAVAASAVGVALYAVVQDLGLDPLEFREASGAPTRFPGSTIGNSNFAGGYLAITVVATAATLARAHGRARWGWSLALAAQIGGLWVTQSRGGLLAAGAGLAVLATATAQDRRRRIAGAVALAAVAGAVVLASGFIVGPPDRQLPDALARLEVLRSDSAEVRGFEWRAAWRATLDRPVLGGGPDTFVLTYPPHRERADGASLGLLLSDKPHNLWLEWSSSVGLVGLGAWIAVLVTVLASARRAARADPAARGAVAVIGAALTAHLVQATFSIDVAPLAAACWVLLGVLASFGPHSSPWPTPPRGFVAAASVAVVVVAALGSAAIGASFALDRGLRQQGRHPEQSLDWFDRAITLAPENAAHRRAAGFAAEQAAVATTDRVRRKQLIADSVGHYEAALERQPDDVAIMVDLARVLLLRAQSIDPRGYVESARWWSAAVERDPHDWELRELSGLAHTEWANRSGDPAARRRAELDLAAVVDLRPDYYNGWLNLARTQIALGELDAADASIDRAFDIVPYSAPAIEVHEDLDQARARALSS